MAITWMRCENGNWCKLSQVNDPYGYGVYVIWCADAILGSVVVRVGQGIISERLEAHREDPDIIKHAGLGELLVTWAVVANSVADQVERSLAEYYAPKVGERFPDVPPAVVNFPFPSDRVPASTAG